MNRQTKSSRSLELGEAHVITEHNASIVDHARRWHAARCVTRHGRLLVRRVSHLHASGDEGIRHCVLRSAAGERGRRHRARCSSCAGKHHDDYCRRKLNARLTREMSRRAIYSVAGTARGARATQSRNAIACARRLKSIDSARIRADSCGAWKPFEFSLLM